MAMNNIMIDLEALDPSMTGVLVSLGAVKFDLETCELGACFYAEVTIPSMKQQIEKGRTVNLDTIAWWMQQSDEARSVFFGKKDFRMSTEELLAGFSEFCPRNSRVWGNGVDFDCSFLRSVYETYEISCPFLYRNNRCYRTFKGVFGNKAKLIREGTHHNALDDSWTQAEHLIAMYKKITQK